MPLMMLEDAMGSRTTRQLRQSLMALGLLPHTVLRSRLNRRLLHFPA